MIASKCYFNPHFIKQTSVFSSWDKFSLIYDLYLDVLPKPLGESFHRWLGLECMMLELRVHDY